MEYIKRAAEQRVLNANSTFKVIVVTGPRQVGKTTMLKHLAEEENVSRNYVSLDDFEARNLAQNEPKLFLERFSAPILIDEIQQAPELLPYIKMQVDANDETGQFWLTGSQPFHLMKGISESLAGRACIIELLGLSNSELSHVKTATFTPRIDFFMKRCKDMPKLSSKQVFQRIISGSYPAIHSLDESNRREAYESLISTYVMRDIRTLKQVGDETKFYTFLKACAALDARPINYAELARVAGIDPKTAEAWLSLLETSYIVKLLPAYSNNLLKRLSKCPVLHFVDTGLASHLTGWRTAEQLMDGAMAGHILETFAHNEIYKSLLNTSNPTSSLYFFRNSNKQEIDLLLDSGSEVFPIEVKKSAKAVAEDIKAVKALEPLCATPKEPADEVFKRKIGLSTVLNLNSTCMPISKKSYTFPIWAI